MCTPHIRRVGLGGGGGSVSKRCVFETPVRLLPSGTDRATGGSAKMSQRSQAKRNSPQFQGQAESDKYHRPGQSVCGTYLGKAPAPMYGNVLRKHVPENTQIQHNKQILISGTLPRPSSPHPRMLRVSWAGSKEIVYNDGEMHVAGVTPLGSASGVFCIALPASPGRQRGATPRWPLATHDGELCAGWQPLGWHTRWQAASDPRSQSVGTNRGRLVRKIKQPLEEESTCAHRHCRLPHWLLGLKLSH